MTTSEVFVGTKPIPFPEFTGERIYMRRIVDGIVPPDLARWAPTIEAMLAGVNVGGPVYLMVDQMHARGCRLTTSSSTSIGSTTAGMSSTWPRYW